LSAAVAIARPNAVEASHVIFAKSVTKGSLLTKQDSFDSLEDLDYWVGLCRLQTAAGVYDKALEACEQAIALEPEAPDLWAMHSNVLVQMQTYPDAIASAERALFFDESHSLAMTYRCIAYAAMDEYELALDSCNEALRINGYWGDTSPSLAWLYRGMILRQTGQLAAAAIALERTLLLEPDYSLALAYQCQVQTDLGQLSAALDSCEQALASNDDWGNESAALAWAALGQAQVQLSDYDAAIAAYDQAIRIDPHDPVVWTAQGQVLRQLQRSEAALASFTRATELDATYAVAHLGRCAALNRLADYEAALEACNLALQGDGRWGELGLAEVFDQRSVALAGTGAYEEALASVNRAIGILPNYAAAHNHRAAIFWYLERYGLALETNQTALELEPTNVSFWLNRGVILRSIQQYEAALSAYDQGLQFAPYDEDLLANRSVVLWHLQRYPEALAAADQAIAFNPQSVQGWYNRATALSALQQWEPALAAYNQVLSLAPENLGALTGQGIVLIRLGQFETAIAALQRAIALNPGQTLAQQSLQTAQRLFQEQQLQQMQQQ
jgi:tetratricopeptide (TPR) repeat protein